MAKNVKSSGKGSKGNASKTDNGRPKTACPITRDQFNDAAKPIDMAKLLAGKYAEPREFKTGTLGYMLNEKGYVEIDGEQVKVQIQASIFVIGSKEIE